MFTPWMAQAAMGNMVIETKFVKDLRRALNLRHITEGAAMLSQAEQALEKLPSGHPHATELLLLVAQWVDVGYRNPRLLDLLLEKFPLGSRRKLALEDFLRLRMVEGFRALSAEEVDRAIDSFDFILRAEREAPDEQLATLAHFWKGRAHRKKGEYEIALREMVTARELAQKNRELAMLTAVIQ